MPIIRTVSPHDDWRTIVDEPEAVARLGEAVDELRTRYPGVTSRPGPNADVFGKLTGQFQSRIRKAHCQRRGCSRRAIPKSHVLAQAAALRPLAEDGFLAGPDLRHIPPTMDSRMSITTASTFPGYCREHELEFASFENLKRISSLREATLQAMRSAAREHWRAELDAEYTAASVAAFRTALDRVGMPETEMAEWGRKLLEPADLIHLAVQQKADGVKSLLGLLEDSLDMSEDDVPVVSRWIHAPTTVAISGSTRLAVQQIVDDDDGKVHLEYDEFIVLAVMPETDFAGRIGSRVIVAARSAALARAYADANLTTAGLPGLIRAWMGGTDHWFSRPSAWHARSREDRRAILTALAAV